jgi:hypothetical protein
MAEKTNWVIIALVAAVVYLFASQGAGIGSSTNLDYNPPVSDQCAITPAVGNSSLDALVPGTTVTLSSAAYRINDKYAGTALPTAVKGDKWEVLVDASNYLASIANKDVGCGAQRIDFALEYYTAPTVTFQDKDYNTLADQTAGTGANATAIAAGTTSTITVSLQGASQKVTGDMLFVIETPASSAGNVSKIALSCDGAELAQATIPTAISSVNSGSYRAAFEIPSVKGSAEKVCKLQITTQATKVLTGAVLGDFYVKQNFVDTDGSFKYGYYDSDNTAKYQATFDHDFIYN